MSTTSLPVVISGAGPSGLLLAVWLQHDGIPYRIFDPNHTTGTTSRAVVVHARILEFYDQLGLADKAIEKGEILESACVCSAGEIRARLPVGKSGEGQSRYPFILSLGQDDHEELLETELKARGGKVERGKSLIKLEQYGDHCEVIIRSDTGSEESIQARYVVGCDGAHSAVRHLSGIKMEGGTYTRRFFVADVMMDAAVFQPKSFSMCLSRDDFAVAILLKGGRRRIIGFTPEELCDSEDISFDDCLPSVRRNIGEFDLHKVNWFSHYKVHHRSAEHFRHGRVFLCGDAAHLHSPVGGQGMNTGLGDVTNLAWKLAAVWNNPNQDVDKLLDTFDVERSAFARSLVATTDSAFSALTSDAWYAKVLRNHVIPLVAPVIVRFNVAPTIYQNVSQLAIAYPQSSLSTSYGPSTGRVKPGSRIPWLPNISQVDSSGNMTKVDSNYAALKQAIWQAHAFGQADWATATLDAHGVKLCTFEWSDSAEAKGFGKDVLYLVRPDQHVGAVFAAGGESLTADLSTYISRWGVGGKQT